MTVSTLETVSDIGGRQASNVDKRPESPHVQEPTPIEQSFDHATRRASVADQRRRGSIRPTPWRREAGTSVSSHRANQISRGSTPSARASAAVR